MGIYKTYKEAVIANGSVKGIFTDGKRFYTDGTDLKYCNIKPCNPADYLETLADFLAGGKRLVDGDYFVTAGNNVVSVGQKSVSAILVNKPGKTQDNHIYVVKAAAYDIETLEEKEAFDAIDTTPNQVEWKNGDDVVFGKDNRKGIYIACDTYNVGHVVYSRGDYFYVRGGDFRKPETAEQREERERLEAAYDLYCEVENADGDEPYDFDFWRTMERKAEGYLAIVDKTGYRKD